MTTATKIPRQWADIPPAQQAGIRCGEPAFWKFLAEVHRTPMGSKTKMDHAAGAVRLICGVTSRKEFKTNETARKKWYDLDRSFQLWMQDIAL